MKTILRRYLPALVFASVGAALACDLSHVYDAYRLMKVNKERAARIQPLLDQDIARTFACAWPKIDATNNDFPTCIAQVLPNLQTGVGLYTGTLKASVWLAQHPEDKETKALALKSVDRLWDLYRKQDESSYRATDEMMEDLNQSVLFRALHDAEVGGFDILWEQKLRMLEVAVNDPMLAEKQRKRTMQYAMEDAQASNPKAGN
jgi:hypothetical protein